MPAVSTLTTARLGRYSVLSLAVTHVANFIFNFSACKFRFPQPIIFLPFARQKKEFVEVKKRTKEEVDEQDAAFDFVDFRAGADRLGWLVTYSAITVSDPETGAELSGENERKLSGYISRPYECQPR